MPIYAYRCSACGQTCERLQKLADAPLTDCPACGQATLVKMVTAAGFQLKGGGWYATDFRGGAKPPSDEPPTQVEAAPAAAPAPSGAPSATPAAAPSSGTPD